VVVEDKICDQVSDAIVKAFYDPHVELFLIVVVVQLDACLEQDPWSKVACETAAKTGMIMVFGEISTKANLDCGNRTTVS